MLSLFQKLHSGLMGFGMLLEACQATLSTTEHDSLHCGSVDYKLKIRLGGANLAVPREAFRSP